MIGFALDMDGTVYHGERPIPGAREFISRLNAEGIPFRFITNNSSHPKRFYADRLKRMGFEITEEHVLTSTIATIRFIRENRPGKSVYVLATPDVTEEIRSAGIPGPKEGETVCMLQVETYAMRFDLFSFEDDGIEPGFVLHGEAWIFGTLKRA